MSLQNLIHISKGLGLLSNYCGTIAAIRRLSMYKTHISGGAAAVLKTRKSIPILDANMSYLDTGAAGNNTALFLHGNPTSSYLWRNVIPHVQPIARCLAPDLIGMGHSDKLADHDYSYENHYRYLSTWIDKMALPEKITIVCHDWGSGLGFLWCHMNKERVHSIIFMEALPCIIPTWEDFPETGRKIFQDMRSEGGEEMILQENVFVESILPSFIMRKLTDEEMKEYRRPFQEPGESRRPTLTWPREIPIGTDGPQNVVDKVNAYSKWLGSTDIPKLYIDAEPGALSVAYRNRIAEWPNLKTVKAKGLHFLQEDSPDEIGKAIVEFLQNLG